MYPDKPILAGSFGCPGCGRGDGSHPPLCQVAVRLTAAHAARSGGDWRERLLAASVFYVNLFGCRWTTPARHYRAAAADDPPEGDAGEALEFSPADWLFRSEAQPI